MTPVLTLLGLTAFAYLASFLLSSRQRHGYGLVSGAEFVALGLAVGPAGLGFMTPELLEAVSPAVAVAIGWLGFRLGLRVRPAEVAGLSRRQMAASLLEPVLSAVILFGLLFAGDALLGLGLPALGLWALAVVGSATTKSGLAWVSGRYGAGGPVTDLLTNVARLDDIPAVLALGALVLVGGGEQGAAHPQARLALAVAGGPALAALAVLLLGRGRFRAELAWVAMLGFTALGTGLSLRLGVSAAAVLALFGATLGIACRSAPEIVRITEQTERPATQVLLVLLGAQLAPTAAFIALGLGFAALRLAAKLAGGLALGPAAGLDGSTRFLGAGLFHSGGVAAVVAVSFAHAMPDLAQPALWAFAFSAVVGDLVGSPALKALLRRAGELSSREEPASEEAA